MFDTSKLVAFIQRQSWIIKLGAVILGAFFVFFAVIQIIGTWGDFKATIEDYAGKQEVSAEPEETRPVEKNDLDVDGDKSVAVDSGGGDVSIIIGDSINQESSTPISATARPSETPTATPTPLPTITLTPTPDPTMEAMHLLVATPDPSFKPLIRESEGGSEQVFVPSGDFIAGDMFGLGYADESVHMVYTDDFWIDRFLVTNIQYARCVDVGICSTPDKTISHVRPNGYYGISAYDNYPVMEISWDQANTFCEGQGGRLPTEAEFEKAGGWKPQTGEITIYPWGNNEPNNTLANYDGVDRDTKPVDRYLLGISAVGAYDMAGNLWQWTADWYDENYYADNQNWINPTGPENGVYRVIRGGSWYSTDTRWLRVSNRGQNAPENAGNEIGFRCVLDE